MVFRIKALIQGYGNFLKESRELRVRRTGSLQDSRHWIITIFQYPSSYLKRPRRFRSIFLLKAHFCGISEGIEHIHPKSFLSMWRASNNLLYINLSPSQSIIHLSLIIKQLSIKSRLRQKRGHLLRYLLLLRSFPLPSSSSSWGRFHGLQWHILACIGRTGRL